MKTIENIKDDIKDWDLSETEVEVYFEDKTSLKINKIYFLEYEFIELDSIAEIIYQNKLI